MKQSEANRPIWVRHLLSSSLCALTLAGGCDPAVGAKGTVIDSSGKPISGVKIEFENGWTSISTNEPSGTFRSIGIGTVCVLRFSKDGYKPISANIGSAMGGIRNVD
ncbi:MAG TPA: carboxypeptidase-like regulatory domain-containing protein, partial [Roseimicrobium sp.]|nr:carboxypeptidase-like regulatory domain-containing protein [Roseimicrobium sp.]